MSDFNLLIVEEDPLESAAIIRAARDAGIRGDFLRAADGAEALVQLRGETVRGMPSLPVILLGLSMPDRVGLQFLRELRSDPSLRRAMVFVFSGSNRPSDRALAYELNAAGYIRKPNTVEALQATLFVIKTFLDVVELQ